MYGAIWRALPGPAWLKAIGFVGAAVAVAVVCILWVFPAVQSVLPQDQTQVTVGSGVIEDTRQEF